MALCESKHCSVLNICKAFKMILNPNIVYLNDSHLNAVSLHFCVKQIMTCMKNEQTVKNKMIKGESKEYHTYKPKWKTKQTKTIRCNSWPCTHKTLRNVTSKWRALFFFLLIFTSDTFGWQAKWFRAPWKLQLFWALLVCSGEYLQVSP